MIPDPVIEVIDGEIRELVPGFLERRRQELGEARHALAAGDAQALHRIGHTLKGTAGSFGFRGMASLGVALEDAALAGDPDALGRVLDDLENYLSGLQLHFR